MNRSDHSNYIIGRSYYMCHQNGAGSESISTWVYLGPGDVEHSVPAAERLTTHRFQLKLRNDDDDTMKQYKIEMLEQMPEYYFEPGLLEEKLEHPVEIEIYEKRPEYELLSEETLLKRLVSSRIAESRHQQYLESLGISTAVEPEPEPEREAEIHLAGRRYRNCNLYNSNDLKTSLSLQEPLNLMLAYPVSFHDIELLANFTHNLGLAIGPRSGVNAALLQPLAGKENLKSLFLILAALPEPSNEFLEWIQSLAGLENLSLRGPKFTAAIGDSLNKLPQLKALEIRETKVTAEILAPLQASSSLLKLDLSDNPRITDQFFEVTTFWPLLHELNLGNTAICDSSVNSLLHFTRLEILSLENTKITDQSLPILMQMTQLTWLNLRNTNISFLGALDLIHSLKGCVIHC